jgi:hypothetical protein
MFFCRGQEIKRSPAVWQSGLEFLHSRNLVAYFLGIGRLGGRALNFFLILGTCDGRGTQNCQDAKNRKNGSRC